MGASALGSVFQEGHSASSLQSQHWEARTDNQVLRVTLSYMASSGPAWAPLDCFKFFSKKDEPLIYPFL